MTAQPHFDATLLLEHSVEASNIDFPSESGEGSGLISSESSFEDRPSSEESSWYGYEGSTPVPPTATWLSLYVPTPLACDALAALTHDLLGSVNAEQYLLVGGEVWA
jgi:hypothetical protein